MPTFIYRYRVKNLTGLLNKQARSVNFLWNYCNDRQKDAIKWNKKWLTGFDLNNLTAGSGKDIGLHSGTINATCQQYAASRFQTRRPYLRYRGRRSLGWVPFRGRDLKREGNAFRFFGNTFRVFHSRPLPDGKLRDGCSFSQDARGNWYINIVIETADVQARMPFNGVGIDLGLNDFAALSTGEKIDAQRIYRNAEEQLATAQRARKKQRVKSIHLKIARRRSDFLHKLSTRIAKEFDYIAVGNVNAAGLAKTSLAKSVLDAGWTTFRNMLRYKAIAHGAWFNEVSERFTTQTCSACGDMPESRPHGIAGLRIKEWVCSACGTVHDRDHNAALNILRRGCATPVEGAANLHD